MNERPKLIKEKKDFSIDKFTAFFIVQRIAFFLMIIGFFLVVVLWYFNQV